MRGILSRGHERHTRRGGRGGRGGRWGFTLLEMIIVVAIIGMLAALVLPRLMRNLGDSEVKITKAQLSQAGVAIEQFRSDAGRYPTEQEGLKALLEAPIGLTNWRGPYFEKKSLPRDGWGRELIYKEDSDFGFRLVSRGADGKEGGEGNNADLDNRQ